MSSKPLAYTDIELPEPLYDGTTTLRVLASQPFKEDGSFMKCERPGQDMSRSFNLRWVHDYKSMVSRLVAYVNTAKFTDGNREAIESKSFIVKEVPFQRKRGSGNTVKLGSVQTV